MRAISCFSVREGPRGGGNLRLDDRDLGVTVDGRRVEAQFALPDGGYLVMLSDDSPFDEGLHVYLLDADAQPVDALEAGADFTAGLLRIRDTGRDWLRFEFFTDGALQRLDILAQAEFRWRLPSGWRYKRWVGRHRLLVSTIRG